MPENGFRIFFLWSCAPLLSSLFRRTLCATGWSKPIVSLPLPRPAQVKDVLGHLEDTLLELTSLGQPSSDAPRPPISGRAFRRHATGNPVEAAAGAAPGGIFGEAARPAWQQLLDRVKTLSRCACSGSRGLCCACCLMGWCL